jgi:phosphohistidine phosphatase
MGVRISRILTSPLVRARETAEILAPAVGDPPIDIVPEFASGARPGDFLTVLSQCAEESSIGIVGHEPDLGWCTSSLLGLDSKKPIISFKKGAIACLDIEFFPRSHQATLQWFLQPSQLRQLG